MQDKRNSYSKRVEVDAMEISREHKRKLRRIQSLTGLTESEVLSSAAAKGADAQLRRMLGRAPSQLH